MTTAAAQATEFQKRFKYHHGNLREALLAAAQDMLATEGVEALSLRALARATGVTQAAPYSHFRDKDELLAAIAETGFQKLALGMAQSAAQGTPNPAPADRISRLILGYIRFAQENSALFGLMFGREIADMKRFPTLAMTAGKSYALISAALSRHAPQTAAGREDVAFLTVAVWSLCHGLTTLIAEQRIDIQRFGAADTEAFVRRIVDIFAPRLEAVTQTGQ